MKEVGSAVGAYHIQFPWTAIALVVLSSLVLMALGFVVGGRPFPVKRLRGALAGCWGLLPALRC